VGLYFNEIEPFAAEWIENLFPGAVVDRRSIHDVTADDVRGFERVHFFGGVAGWELALRLAGWPEDRKIWTGSCPCQPFSSAGKRKGNEDERHLWPVWFRLIRECRPQCVFGEQVESAIGHGWLDGVSADLEREGYAVGACVLGAHSVGAPPMRQRLFWVAYRSSKGLAGLAIKPAREECTPTKRGRHAGWIPDSNGQRPSAPSSDGQHGKERDAESRGNSSGLEFTANAERRQVGGNVASERQAAIESGDGNPWRDFIVIACRDGKFRRVSAQSGDEPLAYGVPSRARDPRMGFLVAQLVELGHSAKSARRVLAEARANRTGRLRGYGNAIVPQVAATFIEAFLETETD